MKNSISKRDWETISAYLDGQLSERKHARLESRLAHDLKLRAALDELNNIRQVLRSTPCLRAPRNFMLTPEMAGQPRRMPRLAPVFGWASAVASFLFVLFLVGDLFSTGGAIPMALNNIPAQEEVVALSVGATEDEVLAQSAANTSRMEESSTRNVEVAESESPEGDVAPEVAAAPEIEPETEASDIVASEEVAEETDSEIGGEEIDTSVAYSAEPVAEDPSVEYGTESRAEVASITETLAVESTPEQHLLAPPVVEESDFVEDEQPIENIPLPTETVVLPPAAKALPTNTELVPQPTITDLSVSTELPLKGSAPVEKQADFLIGAEVILGLMALGAGLAWVYLRRRGG